MRLLVEFRANCFRFLAEQFDYILLRPNKQMVNGRSWSLKNGAWLQKIRVTVISSSKRFMLSQYQSVPDHNYYFWEVVSPQFRDSWNCSFLVPE